MKRRHVIVAFTATVLGRTAFSVVGAGCAGGTGSKRFSFQASAGGEVPAGSVQPQPGTLSFTNQTGWQVSLAKADVTIGPIYLNVVPPLSDTAQLLRGPSIHRSRTREWNPFTKSAWAHGEGHLGAGRIVGEVLGQVTFSALSPTLVPFPTLGSVTQDDIRTAEIWFYPEPGVPVDSTKIATAALDVAGIASREGVTVRFRGALKLDDAWQSDAPSGTRGTLSIAELRKVRGIQTSFFPSEGGRLEIRVDITRFFRGADFSNLEANPIDRDGTKILVQAKTGKVTTDQVMTNLYQGLRESNGTYSVRWLEP